MANRGIFDMVEGEAFFENRRVRVPAVREAYMHDSRLRDPRRRRAIAHRMRGAGVGARSGVSQPSCVPRRCSLPVNSTGILDPQGPIASAQLLLLINATEIMLVVVVPVILATLGCRLVVQVLQRPCQTQTRSWPMKGVSILSAGRSRRWS